jgi:hypothetical protein
MKTILLSLALIASASSVMAAPQAQIMCASTGSIDGISTISVTAFAEKLVAITTNNQSGRSIEKVFNSAGTLNDVRIQLSQMDKGPYGIDRVFLEKTGSGFALVKTNQCSFVYQEETCSAQEDEQFEEVSRDANVACVLAQ